MKCSFVVSGNDLYKKKKKKKKKKNVRCMFAITAESPTSREVNHER